MSGAVELQNRKRSKQGKFGAGFEEHGGSFGPVHLRRRQKCCRGDGLGTWGCRGPVVVSAGILQLYSSWAGGEAAGEGSRLKARAQCGAGMGGFWGAKPQKPCSSPGTADTHVAAV